MSPSTPLQVSLFKTLTEQLGAMLPTFQANKATLVDISHTLEDMILHYRLPSVVFTGFQESSHWRQETERYLELANIASQVCIFAGGEPPIPAENHIAVVLDGDDPLRQEWFLLILTRHFSAVLCGQDNLAPADSEANRTFTTILSFQPEVVKQVLDTILPVVQRYRPDRATELDAAQREFPPCKPDGPYLTSIITNILDHLQGRYIQLNSALRELRELRQEQLALREQQLHLEDVVSALAVPVVPLFEGIIALPLVGSIDTRRAGQILEQLLIDISEQQADIAIIDITGVPIVDTAVANGLLQPIRAASLLGAQVILTGIGSHIAMTLVTLGIDFVNVTTCSTLREGIAVALAIQDFQITPMALPQG